MWCEKDLSVNILHLIRIKINRLRQRVAKFIYSQTSSVAGGEYLN